MPLGRLQQDTMTKISALWTQIASSDRLRRSSQAVSILGDRVYVFGGELLPREPVDNQVDFVELKYTQGSILPRPLLSLSSWLTMPWHLN